MSLLAKCKECGHTKVYDSDPGLGQEYEPCPKCGGDMEIVKDGEEKETWKCECLKCKHTITTEKHCNEIKCPKCGGEMRRADRPGPGRQGLPATLKTAAWPMGVAKVDDIDRKNKKMVVRISSDALDRDKEVLLPTGMLTEHYRKNPIVLWAHDYGRTRLPIAKSLWEKVVKYDRGRREEVLASPQFSQKNQFAMEVFDLYDEDILRAWSVGFDPQPGGSRLPTEEDIKARPDWAGCSRIYEKWELYEFSAVPVPSNPDALALAVRMGTKSIPEAILEDMKLPNVGEDFVYEKPYPNEHACRMRNPGDFQEDSFRRMSREHDGKKYAVIMGRLKGETTLTEQAYRYPKDTWSAASAKGHCTSHHGIRFTPAKDVREEELFARPVKQLLIAKKPTGVIRAIEARKLTAAALKGRVIAEED